MEEQILSRGFWKLPHCSKLGILREDRHSRIILDALRDAGTGIEETEPAIYTLYGLAVDEALLVHPQSTAMRFTMILCESIQRVLSREEAVV